MLDRDYFDNPLASEDEYHTHGKHSSALATLRFYASMVLTVWSSSRLAKRGAYDGRQWANHSIRILRGLERAGVKLSLTGMDNLRSDGGPAVIVANHMSTLETFVLPGIVHPMKPCTFVVKPSLLDYPVFGHVMRARNPIVVSRDNPRKDLVTVLEEGKRLLVEGTSIILFPQTTRRSDFVPEEFNSLGVKLAKSAGVPVIPCALKTDAWANGTLIKDFGKIDPAKTVHFAFGEPVSIASGGKAEHQQIINFIAQNIAEWNG